MTENVDTITRQALGRNAFLGDLYDARTDKFCALNLFNATPHPSAIQKQDNPYSDISITTSSSTDEKLNILHVNADLKLSFLAGMVETGVAAQYLNESKDSFKSVESAIVCRVTTKVEKLDIVRDDVKPCISVAALKHPTATHVVVQIDWGANCTIRATYKNSENKEKKEVEGCLNALLEKLKGIVSANGEGKLGLTKQDRESWKNFSLEIFGDVLPDKLRTTVDDTQEMMRNLPQLIQKCNDGKGKPLQYVMFPLSSPAFQNKLGITIPKNRAVKQIDEGQIIQCIQLYDHILELIQKAHDQVEEMNNHSYCVTESELNEARSVAETLKAQEGSFKSKLKKVIIEVRSGNNDSGAIADLCTKNRKEANETFKKCKKIFDALRSRIAFAEDCVKFGANHFQPPVRERIARACDDYENVFVLFRNKADSGTVQRYQSAFIELAKNSKNDSKTACYVTWSEQTEDVRIEHYRKGQLLHKDITKQLESKDMAQCIVTARRAANLQPFKVRCPGSDCGNKERLWTCVKCYETLQFCPDDKALYCSCGHAMSDQFQFRCHSKRHGAGFTGFKDKTLQQGQSDNVHSTSCVVM